MSGREPAIKTLREFGSGLTAASSTWAVALRNLGLAFMLAPRVNQGEAAPLLSDAPRFPAAALSASGSKGLSHPARGFHQACQDPQRVALKLLDLCDNCKLRCAPPTAGFLDSNDCSNGH